MVRRSLVRKKSASKTATEATATVLGAEAWNTNEALWREHFITNRIRRLIYGGFWPPPIGWCTDLLSDGAYELPKEDFIESLNTPRPRLVCVNGERV